MKSRAKRLGEHSYLLNRIPEELWKPAVERAAQEHAQVCAGAGWRGQTASPERCPVHSMRAVLLDLLKAYGRREILRG